MFWDITTGFFFSVCHQVTTWSNRNKGDTLAPFIFVYKYNSVLMFYNVTNVVPLYEIFIIFLLSQFFFPCFVDIPGNCVGFMFCDQLHIPVFKNYLLCFVSSTEHLSFVGLIAQSGLHLLRQTKPGLCCWKKRIALCSDLRDSFCESVTSHPGSCLPVPPPLVPPIPLLVNNHNISKTSSLS